MEKVLSRQIKSCLDNILMHAENLGIAAKLYEKHTATYFTEAFGNVMYNDSKGGSKYQKINSLMFEWIAAPYNGNIIRIKTLIAGSY